MLQFREYAQNIMGIAASYSILLSAQLLYSKSNNTAQNKTKHKTGYRKTAFEVPYILWDRAICPFASARIPDVCRSIMACWTFVLTVT